MTRDRMSYIQYHFSSPRLELFHLAHPRYFVKLQPTQGAYDPMDSRLLRSTSDMSELSQWTVSVPEVEFLKQAIAKGKSHWKIYQRLCELMIKTVHTEG